MNKDLFKRFPSECTHQASTTEVLMLENATRTHEYSHISSTHW